MDKRTPFNPMGWPGTCLWYAEHKEYGKGVTVTSDQMMLLKELLNDIKIFWPPVYMVESAVFMEKMIYGKII